MNKRGMTLVEIIVSIALISIILIFLLNLFLKIRETFNTSMLDSNYNNIASTFIKAIGDDIKEYGLVSVEYIKEITDGSAVILTFDDYRPSKLSKQIQKVLKIHTERGKTYISYTYDPKYTEMKDITSKERLTNITRELPDDIIFDDVQVIHIIENTEVPAIEIKVPILDSKYTHYDINVYGLIAQ